MPIEVKYTEDKKGLFFCAVDRVTGKDIIEKQQKIFNSIEFPKLEYWIVDRSRCTDYDLTPDDIAKIAEIDNEAAKSNPNLLMALVADSSYQYGMSRMFEAHINKEGFRTMVFESMDEATAWITSELSKSA